MADEGELQIIIVDDEANNVAEATKTEDVKKTDTVTVEAKDPALKDLMAQYKELETKSAEQERRAQEAETRRREAEAEAARHREDADTARKRETSSHLDTINTAITASENAIASAKAEIRAAKAAGDVEAELEAIDKLSDARSKLLRYDEARQDIEARQKAPPQRKQATTDPVEAFANSLTEKSAAWVRAHPDYARSEKGLRKLTAADAIAQAEDLIPDTPEYFARVEEYLGITKAEKKAPVEAAQVKQRSAAPPVAPGASVSSNGANSGAAVTLTQREYDASYDGTHVWNWNDPNGKFKKGDPIGHQEFARRKLVMQKQGLYDKSYSNG